MLEKIQFSFISQNQISVSGNTHFINYSSPNQPAQILNMESYFSYQCSRDFSFSALV